MALYRIVCIGNNHQVFKGDGTTPLITTHSWPEAYQFIQGCLAHEKIKSEDVEIEIVTIFRYKEDV